MGFPFYMEIGLLPMSSAGAVNEKLGKPSQRSILSTEFCIVKKLTIYRAWCILGVGCQFRNRVLAIETVLSRNTTVAISSDAKNNMLNIRSYGSALHSPKKKKKMRHLIS